MGNKVATITKMDKSDCSEDLIVIYLPSSSILCWIQFNTDACILCDEYMLYNFNIDPISALWKPICVPFLI